MPWRITIPFHLYLKLSAVADADTATARRAPADEDKGDATGVEVGRSDRGRVTVGERYMTLWMRMIMRCERRVVGRRGARPTD